MDRARALTGARSTVLLFALLWTAQPAASAVSKTAIVRIGVDLPLSGDNGGDGLMASEGVDLAIADWNEDSSHRRRFSAVVRDTANGGFANPHQDEGSDDPDEPSAGVASVRAFAADPTVAGVIGAFRSDVAAAEAPLAHDLGLAVISASATAGENDSLFTVAATDTQVAAAAASEARTIGYRQVSLIDDGSARAHATAHAFARTFAAHGGVITGSSVSQATFFCAERGPVLLVPASAVSVLLAPEQRALFSDRGYVAPSVPDTYESIHAAFRVNGKAMLALRARFHQRFMEQPSEVAIAYYSATWALLDAVPNGLAPV
ncbi:MAG TPA: hypothetical protein VGD50_02195, partial [Candidatus Baltobacteraceae bacterium]